MAGVPKWPIRRVRLVVATASDGLVGTLAAYDVGNPDWRDTTAVVTGCRARYGFVPIVLRILDGPRHVPPFGGLVTYLVQASDVPDLRFEPWTGRDPLADEPDRARYARLDGPAAELAWASRTLESAGQRLLADPVQVRTWNLSSIWRIPTTAGNLWLKSTPPFCSHEGAVMSMLGDLVPPVVGWDAGRILLGDVEGADQYDASTEDLCAMIDDLVDAQVRSRDRVDALRAMGARDWRRDAFLPAAVDVFDRYADQLEGPERDALASMLGWFDHGFAELADCGLDDTLVHGDFHSGNVRGTPGSWRFLDWGDSAVGNPMMDEPAMCLRRPEPQVNALRDHWAASWRAAVPGCEPERAALLVRPLAALSGAVVYQDFLDGIEPDERRYHEDDPLVSLRSAAYEWRALSTQPDSSRGLRSDVAPRNGRIS